MTKAFTVVKRVLAFILAALMILSVGISVFATDKKKENVDSEKYDPDYFGSYMYKDGYGTEMDDYLEQLDKELEELNGTSDSGDSIQNQVNKAVTEEPDYSKMKEVEAPSIYDDGGNTSELKPKKGVAVMCRYADNTNDELKVSTPQPDECLSAYTIVYDYKIDNGKWYSESGVKSNCVLSSYAENYQGKGTYLNNVGIMLSCMETNDAFLLPYVNAVKLGTDEYNFTVYQFKPGIQVTVRYRYLLNTYIIAEDGSTIITGSEYSQWSEPFACTESSDYNVLPESIDRPVVKNIEEVTVDGVRYAKVTLEIPESVRELNQGYQLSAANDVGVVLKGQKKTGEDTWEDILINDCSDINTSEFYIPLGDEEIAEEYRFKFELSTSDGTSESEWSEKNNSKTTLYGIIAAVVILILSLSGIASVSLVKKCRAKASENSEEKESDNQSESATEEKE